MSVSSSTNTPDRLARHILFGLLVGLVAGGLLRWIGGMNPEIAKQLDWTAKNILDPFGLIFLRLLFSVVVPLVFSSLMLGIVQLGRLDQLGSMATKTFALFALNMAIGVAIGLIIMNTVKPGSRISAETRDNLLQQFEAGAKDVKARSETQPSISLRMLVEMFMPANLLKSVVHFQILPLIVFALLLGAAATQLDPPQQGQVRNALEIVAALMTQLVHYALKLAPYAVAAMLASVVIKAGGGIIKTLLLFMACALLGMAIHLFGTMSILLKLMSKRSPRDFFRATRTILITAFSTSSSNATLPTTIEVSQKQLGISAPTAGFVLPLGATMNMSGTALYEGCVVLFIAQAYGVDLTLSSQIVLLLLTVLSAVAVAGIPGASLPLIVGLLVNFNIPPEGIALILGVDRLLDMARTVLNVGADVVTACIIDDHLPDSVAGNPGKAG